MDDFELHKARAAKVGRTQIAIAFFIFLFALLVCLPSISACMNGEYWGCWVLENDDLPLFILAGVIILILTLLGVLNLRRAKN